MIMLFHERAIQAKWPPKDKGAEKRKNKVNNSSLLLKHVLLANLQIEACPWAAARQLDLALLPSDPRLIYHRERVYMLSARQRQLSGTG